MGQEIGSNRFTNYDFERFTRCLDQETGLLGERFESGEFADLPLSAGMELEAWLVDDDYQALAINRHFIAEAADPLIVPELSCFNFELNSEPCVFRGQVLGDIHQELVRRWQHCVEVASRLDAQPLMIGILPTLDESRLCLENMSDQQRYRALNEQIFRQRHGWPLRLHIEGETDQLDTRHDDVMLESATTSFQVHMRVPLSESVDFYNASLLASVYVVAACANSPWLFGRDLWDETRIPLFEQAVRSPVRIGCEAFGGRVSFGHGFARDSLFECFEENRQCFDPLLPIELDKYPASLSHLRLHNGTIWRWNRPLIGFEDDGQAHLRIEHRSIPAGPSLTDSVANMALYYGLALHFCQQLQEGQLELPDFASLRDDFYRAARSGLESEVNDWQGGRHGITQGLQSGLLSAAASALAHRSLDDAQIGFYLGVIESRLAKGQTGAAWQREFVSRHGADWPALTRVYAGWQADDVPVHEWEIG